MNGQQPNGRSLLSSTTSVPGGIFATTNTNTNSLQSSNGQNNAVFNNQSSQSFFNRGPSSNLVNSSQPPLPTTSLLGSNSQSTGIFGSGQSQQQGNAQLFSGFNQPKPGEPPKNIFNQNAVSSGGGVFGSVAKVSGGLLSSSQSSPFNSVTSSSTGLFGAPTENSSFLLNKSPTESKINDASRVQMTESQPLSKPAIGGGGLFSAGIKSTQQGSLLSNRPGQSNVIGSSNRFVNSTEHLNQEFVRLPGCGINYNTFVQIMDAKALDIINKLKG